MASRLEEKIHLSARGLLKKVRQEFEKVAEPLVGSQGKEKNIGIADCLMAGLAIFKLKYPSLLQFDKDRIDKIKSENLKSLFYIKQIPCDTYL